MKNKIRGSSSIIPLFIIIFLFLFIPSKPLQILSLFILLLVFSSFFISRIIQNGLIVRRKEPSFNLFRGQKKKAVICLKNPLFFPIRNILLLDSSEGLYFPDGGRYLFSLAAGEEKELEAPINACKRGLYKLGPIVLKGSDPLGFFPWQKELPLFSSLTIYPQCFPLDEIISEGFTGGQISVENKIYEDLTIMRSIRDYIPGDSPKRINWKASARTGSIQTMEYSNTIQAPSFVLLELDLTLYPVKNRYQSIERAIETAASCVSDQLERKQSVGLFSNGLVENFPLDQPEVKGPENAVPLLESLAKIESSRNTLSLIGTFLERHSKLPSGLKLSIISPEITQKDLAIIEILSKKRIFIEILFIGKPRTALSTGLPKSIKVKQVKDYGKDLFIK